MKAILVMDMPESCSECDFKAYVIDEPVCILCTNGCVRMHIEGSEYKKIESDLSTRPDWCPLRELPERANHPDWCDGGRYDKGYNACIDEILGDKE